LLASTSSFLGFGPKIKNPVKYTSSNEIILVVTNNNTVAANDNLAKKQNFNVKSVDVMTAEVETHNFDCE